MEKEKIKFKIKPEILNNYVDAINSIKFPMNRLKEQLNEISKRNEEQNKSISESMKPITKQLKSINIMSDELKKLIEQFPNEQAKIYFDTIKQIIEANNGKLSTRMIEPLNINRQYLSIMKTNNIIEKSSRGIYLSPFIFEDSYFSFQQKYKKAIFSHMNALYFYGMTEEFPYNYTVTVPQSYHTSALNEKCNVFYVADDIYEMGAIEIETQNGNKVRAYDKERCICDIIKSKGRMDLEQVKKTIREYKQSKDKNLAKLSEYAKKMRISAKVMEMVGDSI